MNWVDLVVLAVILVSGLLGLLRGLVREVLGLGAWVGAVLGSVTLYQHLDPEMRRLIANPDTADLAAYGVGFLGTLIVLSVVARVIGRLVQRSLLGSLDRTLGLVFGLARGAFLLVAAYILTGMVSPPEQWPVPVLQARSLPAIEDGAQWAAARIPEDYRPHVEPAPGTPAATADSLMRSQPFGHPTGADPHVLHPSGQ